MEYCATIPPELKMKGFKKKYLLKKAVSPLLPKQVIHHKKQGFVGPMSGWIKKDLKGIVLDWLSEKNLKKHGLLNHETVNNILCEHFKGKENNDTLIWSLLIFQRWFELYIEKGI
jgi:asparagine synthase (glutamine-hydrolysing)